MKELYGRGELMDPAVIDVRLDYLQARAEFDGPESPVFLRVGESERILYIDLCDEKWRAVRISPGWLGDSRSAGSLLPACARHEAAASARTWWLPG